MFKYFFIRVNTIAFTKRARFIICFERKRFLRWQIAIYIKIFIALLNYKQHATNS
jgi:hypothetical protein